MPIRKKVDKDFFKKWNSEMAYVLGFFFADGSHDVNPRGSEYFSFQIVDKQLLVEIRKVLKSNHKLSVRLPRKTTESTQYRLQIGSKEMCKDLRTLGLSSKKARNISLPKIPKEYISHFVRGYFDGDGHVWSGLIHKDRKVSHRTLQVGFTSCSKKFLNELHKQLLLLGLTGGGVYCKKNAYCLKYSTSDALSLYSIMYRSLSKKDLSLRRKRIVFERYNNCGGSSTG